MGILVAKRPKQYLFFIIYPITIFIRKPVNIRDTVPNSSAIYWY